MLTTRTSRLEKIDQYDYFHSRLVNLHKWYSKRRACALCFIVSCEPVLLALHGIYSPLGVIGPRKPETILNGGMWPLAAKPNVNSTLWLSATVAGFDIFNWKRCDNMPGRRAHPFLDFTLLGYRFTLRLRCSVESYNLDEGNVLAINWCWVLENVNSRTLHNIDGLVDRRRRVQV